MTMDDLQDKYDETTRSYNEAVERMEALERALADLINASTSIPIVSRTDAFKTALDTLVRPEVGIRIFNIDYDTSNDDEESSEVEPVDPASLPKSLTMLVEKFSTHEWIESEASEFISRTTGFCHNSFEWEFI